uniref:BTB domain-containing protein n=1 Tax=Panagrellus redivivus TaxID=6233 RepID=A0A7E4V7T8_PANRE
MPTVFEDSFGVQISSDCFDKLASGTIITSGKRAIVGFKGKRWSFSVLKANPKKGLVIIINNNSMEMRGTININYGLKMSKEFHLQRYDPDYNYDDDNVFELTGLGVYDLIEVDVTFTDYNHTYCSSKLTFTNLITDSKHYPTDIKFVVGNESIDVHRFIMSMISPVFYDKLRDKKVDHIEITVADFEAVKTAIDYCYDGNYRCLLQDSAQILRFANAYRIQPIMEKVEPIIESEMSGVGSDDFNPSYFGYFAESIWDVDKYKMKCARIYRDHAGDVGLAKSFADIDDDKLVDIVRMACSLKDEDVDPEMGFNCLDDDYRTDTLTIKDFLHFSDHFKTDAQFVIGDKVIDVHREMLCLISPVFQAAFAHDTKEARTGKIELVDFKVQTVKNVLDYIYGRRFDAYMTLPDYVGMLRFAEKYDIKLIINDIKPHLCKELAVTSFCTIAAYAWDFQETDLKAACVEFYEKNVSEMARNPEFGKLKSTTIVDIIRSASAAAEPSFPKESKTSIRQREFFEHLKAMQPKSPPEN